MFEAFDKIPRLLNTPMVVTEKIDGTNAQVYIDHRVNISDEDAKFNLAYGPRIDDTNLCILAGSRSRWIMPGIDNFGFAHWVAENQEELFRLGTGRHFGEWWGRGIQRGYELTEKRFSLFNTSKWSDPDIRPKCCHVTPILYAGDFNQDLIESTKSVLKKEGSKAAPGFMNPEGVVVYLPKSNFLFKSTYEGDVSKYIMEKT